MVAKIVLREIEHLNEYFQNFLKVIFKDLEIIGCEGYIFNSDTGEISMHVRDSLLEGFDLIDQSIDLKNYQKITMTPSVFYCPVRDEDQRFKEAFELMIAIMDDGLIGLIYVAVKEKNQRLLMHSINHMQQALLIESSIRYMYEKISSYDRLLLNIHAFIDLLSQKDQVMPFHTTNVANLALDLAYQLKLDETKRFQLYIAALLHDIGKMHIPDRLLTSEKKYSHEEYLLIKRHANKSAEMAKVMVSGISKLKNVSEIIKYHHEKYDGSGYEGLKGETIPFLSRILTICDATDAMLSYRGYKRSKSKQSTIKELESCSGNHFDPTLVKAMISVLRKNQKEFGIHKVSGVNYLHHVSLSYVENDCYQSCLGSILLDNDQGHMILKNKQNLSHLEQAKLCFYHLDNIYEYHVHIDHQIDNKLLLTDFTYAPLENSYSIPWKIDTSIYVSDYLKYDAKVIKVGASTLIFEMESNKAKALLNAKRTFVNIPLRLEVGKHVEFVDIESEMMNHFIFKNKVVFTSKHVDVLYGKKDRLLRSIFKKQMREKA